MDMIASSMLSLAQASLTPSGKSNQPYSFEDAMRLEKRSIASW